MAENKNERQRAEGKNARPQTKNSRRTDSAPEPAPAARESVPVATRALFPIVGIGASAGGLDAFEKFFRHMPPDSDMAFVLIQHLDPTHKSQLAELLGRFTTMKVHEAQDAMPVEPNNVYVIVPAHDLAILHGELHLMERSTDRLHRAPIDFFFRTLANDQQNRAVGIVLSGTGSEGALGIKAIKAEGGLVMVQEPQTAQYDGMPRHSLATGMADFVLPPESMPEALLTYARRMVNQQSGQTAEFTAQSNLHLQRILILLRAHTGHDFSLYKLNTLVRRIERRMVIHQFEQLSDYAHFLQEQPHELELLFRELLIEVTSFFRDPDAYASLNEKVIPEIFRNKTPDSAVRVWCPGCSTGEEAYTVAMVIRDYMDRNKLDLKVQIFATDIDSDAIERSRSGVYPETIVADLPHEKWIRYFNKEDGTYRISKSIREMCIFAAQSVAKDPPFSRLDLISCRNLLIYMGPELQYRVLRAFHYALNPKGYLHLGSAESLGPAADMYTVVDRKWKLFQRRDNGLTRHSDLGYLAAKVSHDGPALAASVPTATQRANLRELVERTLLQHYTPAAVVINNRQNVLYVHGRTGKYLEPEPGDANMNIVGMARQGLKHELNVAIRSAVAERKDVHRKGVKVRTNGDLQTINLTVHYVTDPAFYEGLMVVVFEDQSGTLPAPTVAAEPGPPEEAGQRTSALEQELRATKDYLESIIEELETSNEELKSANEELQSANEELQSTNEELETSKEELQSLNEELMTVNTELETSSEQLARINNDLNNLLSSTDIGTIFLDMNLLLQRFTPSATHFVNLIGTDIGRPLAHISTNLGSNHLVDDARAVVDNLVVREREVLTSDGRWCSVRIRPYRTVENVINGVVITFVDITEQKRVQEQLRILTRAIEQSSSAVVIMNPNGVIEYVNPKFTALTGYTPAEAIGQTPELLKSRDHSLEFYEKLWDTIKSGNEWRGEIQTHKKSGEMIWQWVVISPIKTSDGTIRNYVAVTEDITLQKLAGKATDKDRQ